MSYRIRIVVEEIPRETGATTVTIASFVTFETIDDALTAARFAAAALRTATALPRHVAARNAIEHARHVEPEGDVERRSS